MRTSCALAAAFALSLAACGSGTDGADPAAETFTFTLDGSTTTFTGASGAYVQALAEDGGTGTIVTAAVSPIAATIVLRPAGATTGILGASFTHYDASSNRTCTAEIAPEALEITRHATSTGGRVSGSFGPTAVTCTQAPTSSAVSGAFDVTHL